MSSAALFVDRSRNPLAKGLRCVCAVVLVIAVHLCFLWIVAHFFLWKSFPEVSHAISVTVFAPEVRRQEFAPPPLSWKFRMPEDIEVPEPDVQIDNDPTLPAGVLAGPFPQLVMPRPDPGHFNANPELPMQFHDRFYSAHGELLVFVLPDGSIGDARVVTSTGDTRLDKLAAAYVIANWRFIPAYLGVKPIEHWMQVFVRFANT